MDDVAKYNIDRWSALARANALFTQPWPDLDATTARQHVDPYGWIGDVRGSRVLCLAAGGGKQAIAFALLGADVTVVDLSPEQIASDVREAARLGLRIAAEVMDMRELSALTPHSYDIVDHPYSINFVPDAALVFAAVARVLKPGGKYQLMCANPFAAGVTERNWNGDGYTVSRAYRDGEVVEYSDQDWVYDRTASTEVPPPREYLHTLGAIVRGLTANGLALLDLREHGAHDASVDAEPGTWRHLSAVLPPWLTLYCVRDS